MINTLEIRAALLSQDMTELGLLDIAEDLIEEVEKLQDHFNNCMDCAECYENET